MYHLQILGIFEVLKSIMLCVVLLREQMTESEEFLDVTGLSNGNMTKIASLSTSLHDLNPSYGCLAGNPFEDYGTEDRYLSIVI